MCDFEPLHRHVDTLHQLVQAAQSVDEMSQTITDLLSEQRVMTGSLWTIICVILSQLGVSLEGIMCLVGGKLACVYVSVCS